MKIMEEKAYVIFYVIQVFLTSYSIGLPITVARYPDVMQTTPTASPGTCPQDLDVVVMVDGSGSVQDSWNKSIDSVEKFLSNFQIADAKTRVGIIEFSQVAHVVSPLDSGNSLGTLYQLLENLRLHPQNGQTFLEKGLQRAAELFQGAFPGKDVRKVLIIITDGEVNNGNYAVLQTGLTALAQQGVTNFVVVTRKDSDLKGIDTLASKPSYLFIFDLDEKVGSGLYLKQSLSSAVCFQEKTNAQNQGSQMAPVALAHDQKAPALSQQEILSQNQSLVPSVVYHEPKQVPLKPQSEQQSARPQDQPASVEKYPTPLLNPNQKPYPPAPSPQLPPSSIPNEKYPTPLLAPYPPPPSPQQPPSSIPNEKYPIPLIQPARNDSKPLTVSSPVQQVYQEPKMAPQANTQQTSNQPSAQDVAPKPPPQPLPPQALPQISKPGVPAINQIPEVGIDNTSSQKPPSVVPSNATAESSGFKCNLTLKFKGCHRDMKINPRPLPVELMHSDLVSRPGMVTWKTFLPQFICDCANKAQSKAGMKFWTIGIQNYHQCFSGPDEGRYDEDGDAPQGLCQDENSKPCTESSQFCGGDDGVNAVFTVITPEHGDIKRIEYD